MAAFKVLVVIVFVAMLAFQLWMASSSHPTAVRLNSVGRLPNYHVFSFADTLPNRGAWWSFWLLAGLNSSVIVFYVSSLVEWQVGAMLSLAFAFVHFAPKIYARNGGVGMGKWTPCALAGASFVGGWTARATENFWVVPVAIIVLMVPLVSYRRVPRKAPSARRSSSKSPVY